MSDVDERYSLLSRPSGIEETRNPQFQRHLPPARVATWLKRGATDLVAHPAPSLAYGLVVCLVSLLLVYSFLKFNLDYILFPALSGFLIVAPVLAMGLYRKSARLAAGERVRAADLLTINPRSGGQVFFVGLLLCMLALLWMRAAVLIYALFFGYRAFPGVEDFVPMLLGTPLGWGMLTTGICVGGLFAAFGFAVSAFSLPMLLDQRTDALTAMGTSMALVWNNMPLMLTWAAMVLALIVLTMLTGLVGLVVIFPLLGHATWHAYKDMLHEIQP